MLRSGIETLGPEFEVIDIPSGEEAFLELSRHHYNLIVADIRLAGMSGLELKQKTESLNPDLKVILITGITESKLRRQVADAGADAFFFKPIQIASLLNTVERLLGLTKSDQIEPKEYAPLSPHTSTPELVIRIASLREELEAISAVLLDENGYVFAMTGDPPDATIKSDIIPLFLVLLNTSNNISLSLGRELPEDLIYFSGVKYNLSLTHINNSYTLVVVTNTGSGPEYLGTIGFCMHLAAQDLSKLLTSGVPLPKQETESDSTLDDDGVELACEVPLPIQRAESDNTLDDGGTEFASTEPLPDVDDIFQTEEAENLKPEDIDAFWDSSTEETGTNIDISSTEAISYDQARELGLTPDEE